MLNLIMIHKMRPSARILIVKVFIVIMLASLTTVSGARSTSKASNTKTKVVVTGAGSGLGINIFKKLNKRKNFEPIGLVMNKGEYQDLVKIGAKPGQIKIADITKRDQLKGVFEGANKVVLCTSARPIPRLRFRVKKTFSGAL